MDQVWYLTEDRDKLINLLKEHVFNNIVRIGNNYYQQIRGMYSLKKYYFYTISFFVLVAQVVRLNVPSQLRSVQIGRYFSKLGTPHNDSFDLFCCGVDFAPFTCLLPVPCFPRLAMCLMFLRLAMFVIFPTLGNGCNVFPRLVMGVMFSLAW